MPEYPVFRGNCPRNVSKDAKYTVRSGKTAPVIALTYCTAEDERWYMSTEEHPELVAMVNGAKIAQGNPPNGSFYINEYKQVIVPVVGSENYYYAGKYDRPLRFEFEGNRLSGEAFDLAGNPLAEGDAWVGPHPGIPYTLCAGGNDIKYTVNPRPNVEKDIKLGKLIGPTEAQAVAAMVRAHKGHAGGRFYVNEFCTAFAPIQEGWETRYAYLGQIDLERWFPESAV